MQITDAIIPIQNEDTNCDKLINENTSIAIEKANTTDKCDDVIVTAKQNTADNNIVKTQQIFAIEGSSNNTNCTENCGEIKPKSNKINDSATILKYVNKNKELNTEKTKGHPKNSLKRKKRSLNIYTDNARSAKSVPIVNYVHSHTPKEVELKEGHTGNVIQGAALADFNIETLHENIHPKKNDEENQQLYRDDSREDNSESKAQENSDENNNGYRDTDIRYRKPYTVNKDNGEVKVIDKFPLQSEENEESNERFSDKSLRNKETPYSNSFTDRNERREIDKSDELVHPNDSNERGEIIYDNEGRSAFTKPSDDSRESDEKENYNEREKSSYEERPTSPGSSNNNFKFNSHKSKSRPSVDDSNESEEDTIIIMKKKNRKPLVNTRDDYTSEIKVQANTTAVPIKIQDIDLRDFSYERIKVNDKGVVEPAKDVLDNYDEISPLTTTKPIKDLLNKNEQYTRSTEESDSPLSIEINESSDRPIHLNDGEVKPVVEIDRDSNESSEERSKEAILGDSPNEDSSLETFLGVKEIESSEQKDKIITSPQRQEKDDVKQEFERIPLNYQHDKNQKGKNSEDTSPTKTESTPISDNDEATPDDGTLDTLQPPEPRYDENLNIKFDDLTITLPEIKLPEDILAYTYEKPANTKLSEDDDQDKSRFFHYSDETEDNSRDKKKSKNNNYHDNEHDNDDHQDPGYHYDYYGYSKKNEALEKRKSQENDDDEKEEDEEEDLYEKFVRERFGKRGSFQKRSENLQMRPVQENAKLYQTLQNVLKKTEDIQKQADKSDDPNAGFMWTLEYGHNL